MWPIVETIMLYWLLSYAAVAEIQTEMVSEADQITHSGFAVHHQCTYISELVERDRRQGSAHDQERQRICKKKNVLFNLFIKI